MSNGLVCDGNVSMCSETGCCPVGFEVINGECFMGNLDIGLIVGILIPIIIIIIILCCIICKKRETEKLKELNRKKAQQAG